MMARSRLMILRCIQVAVAAGILAAACLAPSCVSRKPETRVPCEVVATTGEARPARVLIVESAPSARLAISAPYSIEPWGKAMRGTPAVLAQCPPLRDGEVKATAAALIVGDRHFPDAAVLIRVHGTGALTVNERRYRGDLALLRLGEGLLSLLNVLPVEDYLYGVLGGETYPAWPAAALEAQAIVARSYALWRMAQRRDEAFDLHATVMDQNYLGMAKETPELRAAVDRTAGLVLLYQLKLFRCYYHSTCGGHTEAVQEVFPDPPLLPLSAVPCQYCKDSKHYSWRKVIPKAELADALAKSNPSIQTLASIAVSGRTPSGRAKEIAVGVGGGRQVTLLASAFRLAVGPAKLPSVFIEVRETLGGYEFQGRGFGHGVGMCQWGARGMAEARFSAAEILRHYYPGAQLTRLYAPTEG